MRYLLKLQYDGSKFYGFQRLNDLPSIQKEIEDALAIIFKENIVIKGAGRTDKGVHAYCQMAHFDTNKELPKLNLKKAINSLVSDYLYVKEIKRVDDNFHARFSVKKKRYEYKINLGEYDPLKKDYYYQVSNKLDIKLMQKASKIFLGVHDFENFVSGQRESYEAIIYKIDFKVTSDTLTIGFEGKSFYRYMVRSLVGALLDIGTHKVRIEDVKKSLDKKETKRFTVALANGLYLMDIEY